MEQQKRTNRINSVGMVGQAVNEFYANLREAGQRGDPVPKRYDTTASSMKLPRWPLLQRLWV